MNPTPFYLLDQIFQEERPQSFTPAIYDAYSHDAIIPEEFNTVLITVNGRTVSDLNWEKERLIALHYVKQGLHLFWHIDLGLFSNLESSLTDQTQFLALKLSLEHFKNSLWEEFQAHTVGVSFYRGPIDFNRIYPWDEEQNHNFQGWLQEHFQRVSQLRDFVHTCSKATDFEYIHYSMFEGNAEGKRLLSLFCCDASTEYFNLLAQSLPDLIPLFHLFDANSLQDPLLLAQLLSKERFARFHRMVTESVLPLSSLKNASTQNGFLATVKPLKAISEEIKIGVCFLTFPYSHAINEVFIELLEKKIVFRVIPEELLMMEWDELDYLIVDLAHMSHVGIRQLRGFCAAGGLIVSCTSPNNSSLLPSYIPFSKMFEFI